MLVALGDPGHQFLTTLSVKKLLLLSNPSLPWHSVRPFPLVLSLFPVSWASCSWQLRHREWEFWVPSSQDFIPEGQKHIRHRVTPGISCASLATVLRSPEKAGGKSQTLQSWAQQCCSMEHLGQMLPKTSWGISCSAKLISSYLRMRKARPVSEVPLIQRCSTCLITWSLMKFPPFIRSCCWKEPKLLCLSSCYPDLLRRHPFTLL